MKMITTVKYDNQNFPIPSERVFEKLLNLPEQLTGQEVKIHSIFNPNDKTPSMVLFYSEDNIYRFKDFSSGRYGDIADVAEHLLNATSRQDAFIKIKKLFESEGEYVMPTSRQAYVKITKEVTAHKIRSWNKRDEIFWKQFYIGGRFLKQYNVKPLDSYELTISKGNHVEVMTFSYPYSYGYFNNAGELCKIYNPLNEKAKFLKVKELIQGEEQLTYEAKCLIIAASLKDIGAFQSMRFKDIELIAPDSENVHIPKEKLEFYKTKYKYIFTMFDNDIAGMKSMKQYKDMYDVPYLYFTVENDIADCVKEHGPGNTKIFFTPVLKDGIKKQSLKINKKLR